MKPYLVHTTDLFHPHQDPDDHFDLATVFALHKLGYFELGRVICDYPPARCAGDPALCAIAQLNEIAGCDVRGCAAPSDPDAQAQLLLEILRRANRPVIFTVVGTTEHIAGAILRNPEIFAEKCAGIYLAAGTGIETPGGILEYNVQLHPAAFAATLAAPCPVYWAPCFHTLLPNDGREGMCGCDLGGEYGSVYCILQKEILAGLRPAMQNYFLYMLSRSGDPQFLRYLKRPVDGQMLADFGEKERRLWSTPLFLTAAGIECESFEFLPVRIRCTEDGHTSWTPDAESNHHIFHIRHCDRQTASSLDRTGSYKEEMVARMAGLFAVFQ